MHSDRKPLAMSALFSKQGGILPVLRTNRDAFTSKAKYLLLDFIAELVKKQYTTTENAGDIHTTCWMLFSHSKELSAVKKSAVHVLIALVEEKLLDSTTLEAMIKRFMTAFIQNQSKLVSSVKCAILELFGSSVRYYPDSFTIDKQDPDHIKRRFLTTMSTCINSSNPDMELLAGAVLGLGSFLHSFDVSEGINVHVSGNHKRQYVFTTAESKEIFLTIRKMIIPLENQTRYAVPKGLGWFACEIIINSICTDRDAVLFIHSCLKSMSLHTNRDMQKLGYGAMTAFLRQVTSTLVERALPAVEIEIFWYFVKDFINSLNKAASDQYMELSQAVRGLGLFAGPCKVLLANKELKELQSILVRKLSSLTSSSNDAKYAHISAFMDAFKMLAHESETIDTEFLTSIEEITISMTLNFSKVRVYYRPPLVKSFIELMWELNRYGLLRSFWGRIAKQLLVISCIEKDIERETIDELAAESKDPTWKEYTTFWETLFTSTKEEWSNDEVQAFRYILYDGMMTAMLELPGDLNLNMRERDVIGEGDANGKSSIPIATDASRLVADNPADFIVFVAFVSLCDALLPRVQLALFEKWIFVAGQKLISYSSHHPLVSGFYKLFGVILAITDTLGYFSPTIRGSDEMDHDALPEKTDSQKSAQTLFAKYIEQVLLKMQQFKDDLLVSCLKMVLSSPLELTRLESLCFPITESLKMGLSYTPLAIVALDAIESWGKKVTGGRKVLKPIYARVLPSLNDYLMLDLEDGYSGSATAVGVKGSKKARSKHLKTFGIKDKEIDEQTTQTLQSIQIRILKLLGSLGQDSHLMLSSVDTNSVLVAWDTEKHLKVQIPFQDTVCHLYFDDILPRIIELAENSPDRKTKVAANELLHALVIVIIGRTQYPSDADRRTPYHKIYVKLFPVLLRLAVDLDKVTRELFRPLVTQLIHWFTKNSRGENPETMALLQSCFDAVSSSSGPLREFGAECIAEYLKWSIKHASEKELENNPINAKSLFKRIYQLCQHSSPAKRLSASIIINKIYAIFRESNALVDVFTMEILYFLMFSLKIADGDNPALGTQSLAKIAIDNMAKIVVVKHDLFVKKNANRRVFPDVESCDLASVVQWLFEQSCQKELEYSYKCIELFDKFASKLNGVPSWIKASISKNERYIFDLLKGSVNAASVSDKNIDSPQRQSWFLSFRSALIVYRYLIDRGAMLPVIILRSSGIVESIAVFLTSYSDNTQSHWTVTATKKLNSDRAFVFLKVLDIIHSSLAKLSAGDKALLDPVFAYGGFFKMLSSAVFEPEVVGFDVALADTKAELFNRLVEVVGGLSRNLSASFKSAMLTTFADSLLSTDSDLRNTAISSRIHTSKYLQRVSGLKAIRACGLLNEVLSKRNIGHTDYMQSILKNFHDLSKSSDLLQIELAGDVLLECLKSTESRFDAFKAVLSRPNVESSLAKETYEKLSTFFNRGICAFPTVFASILNEGIDNSLAVLVLDNFVNWMASQGQSIEDEVVLFIKQISGSGEFVKTSVSCYDRVGEDVLTRFWRKFLQVKPESLNVLTDNAISECFWSDFFVGFNHKSSLKKLNDLCDLLPSVIMSSKSQRIEDALSNIVTEKFPLVSQTIDGSDELMDDYRVVMNKLINIMQQTLGSTVIERVLILHLCRDANHAFNAPFVDALALKVPIISSHTFNELWKFAFEFSVQGKNLPDLRMNVAKALLLPTLQAAKLEDTIGFFVANVKEVISILSLIGPTDGENDIKQSLVTKTICYFLMELAYKLQRIPASELHSATGRVLKALVGPTKAGEKEITIALIKAGGDFKKKQPAESAAVAPYRLAVNQASFNAISACLLATQNLSKVDIFNAYLFVEKPALWDNIIDVSKPIVITTDLDAPLIRVGIKEFSEKSSSMSTKKKYLSTQFLADSSLSQMSSLFGKSGE
ncbi:UNVERIFIED_CONTAM: hypothetical protein HDU68_008222 [Siphonaria sp. JEL0065]|nr:hypothetical protein HDU68_008222 [Siphonaria sp. JEL0065]